MNKKGFTLVEIMIVVAIIGLLAAIAIPNFIKARETSQTNACIENLRQIDSAKQQWAIEEKKESADTPVAADLDDYIKGEYASCQCPAGGTYTINSMASDPTCDVDNHVLRE